MAGILRLPSAVVRKDVDTAVIGIADLRNTPVRTKHRVEEHDHQAQLRQVLVRQRARRRARASRAPDRKSSATSRWYGTDDS